VDGNVAIAPWPEDDGNPYQRLFYEALSPFGFRRHSGLVINDQYLRDHAAQIDAVHLHWPEYAWRVHGTRLDRQARLVIGLARFLRLAGRLGIARVWTAHRGANTPRQPAPAKRERPAATRLRTSQAAKSPETGYEMRDPAADRRRDDPGGGARDSKSQAWDHGREGSRLKPRTPPDSPAGIPVPMAPPPATPARALPPP